jgi:hypothetical protein
VYPPEFIVSATVPVNVFPDAAAATPDAGPRAATPAGALDEELEADWLDGAPVDGGLDGLQALIARPIETAVTVRIHERIPEL